MTWASAGMELFLHLSFGPNIRNFVEAAFCHGDASKPVREWLLIMNVCRVIYEDSVNVTNFE